MIIGVNRLQRSNPLKTPTCLRTRRLCFSLCLAATLALVGPVSAQATAVTVKGTVWCKTGDVVGVWVQSTGGGSKFASRWALPGNARVSGYQATVNSGQVELHVGCGGSPSRWASDQYTTRATVGANRILNAYCTGAAGTFRQVTCSFPPRPNLTPVPSWWYPAGQCTYWAANQWKAATGKLPSWKGNAKDWDDNAAAQKWRVTGARRRAPSSCGRKV